MVSFCQPNRLCSVNQASAGQLSVGQLSAGTSAGRIRVSGVSRSFGAVQAVEDASLEAWAGQVTALIGPTGSGKTTTVLMLASLLNPDAGSSRIA